MSIGGPLCDKCGLVIDERPARPLIVRGTDLRAQMHWGCRYELEKALRLWREDKSAPLPPFVWEIAARALERIEAEVLPVEYMA